MLRALAEHLLNIGFAAFGTVSGVFYTQIDDFFINVERVLRILSEGQLTTKQLVGEHS